MISTPTVFVLGAGASCPYGFPTGGRLRLDILDLLDVDLLDDITLKGIALPERERKYKEQDVAYFLSDLEQIGFEFDEIRDFRNSFRNSGLLSIDSFLEKRDYERFTELGKLCILKILLDYEAKSDVFGNIKGDWYKYIWNMINGTKERIVASEISFITFNYDRSLKHYLYTSILNSFPDVTSSEARELVQTIPIIHVHGKLGHLEWEQSKTPLEYGEIDSPIHNLFRQAQENIQIVSESKPESIEFSDAKIKLADAKRIYFMGCGYHQPNMDRLQISRFIGKPGVSCLGSALGLAPMETSRMKKYMGKRMHFDVAQNDCLSFIRNKTPLD